MALTADELAHADDIGRRRHRAGWTDVNQGARRKTEEERLADDILGARGEKAVSVFLGIPWQAHLVPVKHGGDVGPYQVRTRSRRDWDLIIRRGDAPDDIYILVVPDRGGELVVVGWLRAEEGMLETWWATHGDRPGAWFVPQSALRPFPIEA